MSHGGHAGPGVALPGTWGRYIVTLSVLLFALSTAIAFSYDFERCVNYLFGHRAVVPYRIAFVSMHFVGAILTLSVAWTLGDVFLGIVILPNLLALVLLVLSALQLRGASHESAIVPRRQKG